jgi:hypothetical protein
MIRVILINIVLLSLPFALYFFYVYKTWASRPEWKFSDTPFLWLSVVSVVLMFAGLIALVSIETNTTEGKVHWPTPAERKARQQ